MGGIMRAFFLSLALLAVHQTGSAQTPFYQGKTITVIAAASAGSAYDLYARLMVQFMG
jgi:tripartite-type tricarboxylate transporter receptor subunit TctC